LKNTVYITGHKNPDTDSICAAIAYAEFKNKAENVQAIPIRLGNINRETKFVLDYFDAELPTLMETVKVQVSDLKIDKVAPISPEISLQMAWSIMKKNELKTLPVIDENELLMGIVSVSNLTSSYMDVWDNTIIAKSKTSLDNILHTLSAKCVFAPNNQCSFTGKVVVAAMQPSSASQIIEEGDLVICGDRADSQMNAVDCKASLLIVTGNHDVEAEIIESAKKVGCVIIQTPYDSFTAARLISQSIPISYVMTKDDIVSFDTEDYVDEIKDVMIETRYRSYPVVNKDNKVIGSISRYHLISQNRKKVILVDHNEKSQSVHGLEDADILEIIDHHRIADVQTGSPIYFRNEPVGSTSTIVSTIFFENGIRPSKKTAGLLCAAIISDTLLLKSPTATNVDRIALKRLSEIAQLDLEKFAKEMFKAGTSLSDKSVQEIFSQDFKVFTINNYKVGISQVYTMDIEGFTTIKKEMLTHMELRSREGNFDVLILMLTDILNEGSEMLVVGTEKELVNRAFGGKLTGNSIYVPGVLSRKKQIIPPLSAAISAVNK